HVERKIAMGEDDTFRTSGRSGRVEDQCRFLLSHFYRRRGGGQELGIVNHENDASVSEQRLQGAKVLGKKLGRDQRGHPRIAHEETDVRWRQQIVQGNRSLSSLPDGK